MHEENFLSGWLREDGKEKEEIMKDIGNERSKNIWAKKKKQRRRERRKRDGELLKEDVSVLLFCGVF